VGRNCWSGNRTSSLSRVHNEIEGMTSSLHRISSPFSRSRCAWRGVGSVTGWGCASSSRFHGENLPSCAHLLGLPLCADEEGGGCARAAELTGTRRRGWRRRQPGGGGGVLCVVTISFFYSMIAAFDPWLRRSRTRGKFM